LRSDRIDAPCLFDGPINAERFRAYVEQFLVPTLKPGDVVILDNLAVPTRERRCAMRSGMSEPASSSCRNTSPDLNPIEQVFAKFKTLLRKVEARSYEAISTQALKSSPSTRPPNAPQPQERIGAENHRLVNYFHKFALPEPAELPFRRMLRSRSLAGRREHEAR
jgi:transposase